MFLFDMLLHALRFGEYPQCHSSSSSSPDSTHVKRLLDSHLKYQLEVIEGSRKDKSFVESTRQSDHRAKRQNSNSRCWPSEIPEDWYSHTYVAEMSDGDFNFTMSFFIQPGRKIYHILYSRDEFWYINKLLVQCEVGNWKITHLDLKIVCCTALLNRALWYRATFLPRARYHTLSHPNQTKLQLGCYS
ncbi:hypothetical protein VP01_7326g1, partial [Puccinia sorghi]